MRPLLPAFVALFFATPAYAQLAAPNDAGVAFGHVHLYVTDVELHGNLWTGLFDGRLVEKGGFSAVVLPGTLIFLTEEKPTAPSRSTAMDHVGLAVRDLGAVIDEWQALGYDVESEPGNIDASRRAFVTLPDGVRLELREDPDLQAAAEMGHVHFFAPKPSELRAWYSDLFGASPASGDDGEMAAVASVPGSELTFSASESERTPTEGTVIDHIGFEIEDMDAFATKLRGEGIELTFGPHYVESLDLWVAFFNDPSGVQVEVTEGLDRYY